MPPQENPNQDSGQSPRLRPNFPVDRPLRRPVGDGRLPPRPPVNYRDFNPQSSPLIPPAVQQLSEVSNPADPNPHLLSATPGSETARPPQSPTVPANYSPMPESVPKSKHQLLLPPLKIVGLVCSGGLVIVAIILLFFAQAARNNPDRVFADALQKAMTTNSVQINSSRDGATTQTLLDLSGGKNLISSTSATIQMYGAPFDLKAYGTAQNTYISYQKLPSSVSARVNTAVQGGWVKLRAISLQPPDVPAVLSSLCDPYSQAFGPVIFGNYPQKVRQQLLGYIAAQHIYAYNPKLVTTTSLEGVKVRAYKMKMNIGYQKIIMQSAANSQGIKPADITAASTALDSFKGADVVLYVNSHDHTFKKLTATLNGVSTTITYGHYNATQLTGEPQTKLTWHDFAPAQWQLESETAAHQPASLLDNTRKAHLASLHSLLAQYFAQNNSYPTLANLNDKVWLATNLPGSDPDTFRDPLAPNLTLASSPKAAVFAYQVVGANSAQAACSASASNPCAHYRLTATLSSGQQFIVQDP